MDFIPPLIGGAVDAKSITTLAGIGILLTIPKAVDILSEFLKNPPFKYGSAWSEATKFGSDPFGVRGVGTKAGMTAGKMKIGESLYTGRGWGTASGVKEKFSDLLRQGKF